MADIKTKPKEMALCSDCGERKIRIIAKIVMTNKGRKRTICENERGEQWHGKKCPKCKNENASRRATERRGVKRIDDLAGCPVATGRAAENLVAEFLRNSGFSVSQTTGKGPDIILRRNGIVASMEVKKVYIGSGTTTMASTAVYPKRKFDNYIALVFPNNSISIEPMSSHLNKCRPNGVRFFGSWRNL